VVVALHEVAIQPVDVAHALYVTRITVIDEVSDEEALSLGLDVVIVALG
jgi:hypothetical protein